MSARRIVPLTAALVLVAGALVAGSFARAAPDPSPPPAAKAPRVVLSAPLGGQTAERVVTIAGRVEGVAASRLTLVLNGTPMTVAIANGAFSLPQVLAPGPNAIRAFVVAGGATVEDTVLVHASVPAKDLRVTLTWDTDQTDVDLWLTGPDGEKILYSHRQGAAGGTLDTDVTTGYGPETYTQARLARGTYAIQAHAYRISRPTRVEVTVVRREGALDEERRTFRGVLLATNDVLPVGEFTSP